MADTVKAQRPWALRLLPPFPAVANRILSLVDNADVGSNQVGEIIKLDPTFTAEILRVANSALFGVRREITSVTQAVNLLGLDRVKAMATLVAVNSMVKKVLRIEALRRVWSHSLVTAILAEECAKVSRTATDTAYTTGLLHNLGVLGLMAAYPEEYVRMMDVSAEFGFDLLKTERDLFEIDHCAAGAYLAQEWNFPDEIAAAIATHHEEPEPGPPTLYSIVQVSWRLAEVLGHTAFPLERTWTYEELVAFVPKASKSWLGAGVETAKEEVTARLASFKL